MGNSGQRRGRAEPVLKRTVVRPGGSHDPVDSAFVSDRLTALTHELANLLDGSLRCLCLARRAVDKTNAQTSPAPISTAALNGHCTTNTSGTNPEVDIHAISRHLETVHAAMHQMAALVRTSMGGFKPGLMSPMNAVVGASGNIVDAVRHAVEVMQPLADEQHIDLTCEIDERLREVPAGPVYTVVTSTIRNAIESIQRLDHPTRNSACVRVQARLDNRTTPEFVELEIIDDGEGPPSGIDGGTQRLFEYGVSTKPSGSGVGLAVARDIVDELGGTITLTRRPTDPYTHRTGAVISVRFPCPDALGN